MIVHVHTVAQTLDFMLGGQLRYIQRAGFNVAAIASPSPMLDEFGEKENVPVFRVLMHRKISPAADVPAIYNLWRKLRDLKPTIVHAHTPKAGLLGMIASWIAGTPIRIYHVRGLPYVTAKGMTRALLFLSEKVSCALATRVFAVSPSIAKATVEAGLCRADKITTFGAGSGNGIDAETRFNPKRYTSEDRKNIRRSLNIPEDALVIGFVGRIVHDKGVDDLATAWRVLASRYENLHLILVGEFETKDPVSADTRELFTEDPRVHLTGFVKDLEKVPNFYAIMDIFAFPSHREGFGNAALEASAMELPVVATRITGCMDSIVQEETGLLIPPGSAADLTEALLRYIDDVDLRRIHGGAGRRRALEHFRPEDIWEATAQEYRRLLCHEGVAAASP